MTTSPLNDLDDHTLLRRFEACDLPAEQFNHRSHIRVAYLYARDFPQDEAIDRMRRGIQTLNAANEVPEALDRGYHETLTLAWMRVLATVIAVHGAGEDSNDFLEQQPYVLQRLLLRLFYSRDRIMTQEAKEHFVTPDLAPLPEPNHRL